VSAGTDAQQAILYFRCIITLGARAIIIGGDSFYLYRVGLVASLAARYAIPSIAQWREYPAAGGLMSYGNDISEAFCLTGIYVGRILGGRKAGRYAGAAAH
jgi:putative tryptophan/tyrosine transport system substrate-binding protein